MKLPLDDPLADSLDVSRFSLGFIGFAAAETIRMKNDTILTQMS